MVVSSPIACRLWSVSLSGWSCRPFLPQKTRRSQRTAKRHGTSRAARRFSAPGSAGGPPAARAALSRRYRVRGARACRRQQRASRPRSRRHGAHAPWVAGVSSRCVLCG